MPGSRASTKKSESKSSTLMDGDEKPMSSQRREQVLENCRWLFGQEVQLITFYHTFNNGASNACTALILPKTCSLRDSHANFNSRILWRKECKAKGKTWVTREDAINDLLWEVESKIGEILQTDRKGEFQVNEGAIPSICGQEIKQDQKEPMEEIKQDQKETMKEEELKTSQKSVDAVVVEKKTDGMAEMYELDGKSIRGGIVGVRPGEGQKIWRVVGYTPSGEPCIEEHEPENNNLAPSLNCLVLGTSKAPYPSSGCGGPRANMAEVGLAPLAVDRSMMTDVEAATAHDGFAIPFGDHDELRNFEEDVKQINQLIATTVREGYARLAELQYGSMNGGVSQIKNPSGVYQRTLKDQETAVKNLLFRISKKNQRLAALAALHRQAEEHHNKERIRANESEAREVETNMLLERLFKGRASGGDARSVRSGVDSG